MKLHYIKDTMKMNEKTYTVRVTIMFEVDVKASSISSARQQATELAIQDDCFETKIIEVYEPEEDEQLTDEQAMVLETLSFDRVCVNSAWEAVPGRKDNLTFLRNSGYVQVTDKWFITKAGRVALKAHRINWEG